MQNVETVRRRLAAREARWTEPGSGCAAIRELPPTAVPAWTSNSWSARGAAGRRTCSAHRGGPLSPAWKGARIGLSGTRGRAAGPGGQPTDPARRPDTRCGWPAGEILGQLRSDRAMRPPTSSLVPSGSTHRFLSGPFHRVPASGRYWGEGPGRVGHARTHSKAGRSAYAGRPAVCGGLRASLRSGSADGTRRGVSCPGPLFQEVLVLPCAVGVVEVVAVHEPADLRVHDSGSGRRLHRDDGGREHHAGRVPTESDRSLRITGRRSPPGASMRWVAAERGR